MTSRLQTYIWSVIAGSWTLATTASTVFHARGRLCCSYCLDSPPRRKVKPQRTRGRGWGRCHSKFDRSEIRSRRQNLLGNTIAERFNLLGNTVAPRKYYRALALHFPSTQRTWHSLVDLDLCPNVPRPQSRLTPAFLAVLPVYNIMNMYTLFMHIAL